MRQHLVSITLAIALVFSQSIGATLAAEPDVKELQCGEFDDEDDLANFAFWLDGYISGLNKSTLILSDEIEDLIEETLNACNHNPEKAVFEIVEKIKQ